MNNNPTVSETHENVIAGIVGALLFSLVGGIIWFVLYSIGIVAAISGLIGVVLAIKGYQLFAKKESVKGIIIASVIAFLVLVLAWYLCIGKDVYDAYQEWYKKGLVSETLTFVESLKAVPIFLKEPEIAAACYKDLAIGLVFALIGAIGTIITSIKNIKAKNKLFSSEPAGSATETVRENAPESAAPLRSAQLMDEKVHVYLTQNAFGHEIILRKVAKTRDELVIDGSVYAEHVLEKRVQFPYEMSVFFDGHTYEAGCNQAGRSYISIDKVLLAQKMRF